MAKQLFRTVLVIGENPDEIIKKYDAENITGKHLFFKRDEAEQHRKNKILLLKKSLDDTHFTEQQKELTREYIEILSEMTDLEYFLDLTEGCEYDNETGDAYKEYNPNSFYKAPRSPQKTLEKIGEESGFCNPFKLKDDYIAYSAYKDEIDWGLNHLHNKHVYEIAWDMIVNGKEPRTEAEETIKKNMGNRKGYFENFKDKEDYVSYCTSFWAYGVATNDKYEDGDELGVSMNEWIKNFYNKYIKDLPEDTLLTLYEVQSI